MPDYNNELKGVLFLNKKKETDKHPNYKGTYTHSDGLEYWVDAWVNKNQDGSNRLNFTTKLKEDAAPKQPAPSAVTNDDDLPF
jgi:hypothetical protein